MVMWQTNPNAHWYTKNKLKCSICGKSAETILEVGHPRETEPKELIGFTGCNCNSRDMREAMCFMQKK